MKLVKKQTISASITGSDQCLSTIGALQIVEDSLTELMGNFKIDGITVKNKYNAFWVFVKTKIKFLKKIIWNEEITISSFISQKSLAKLYVDIVTTNKLDEIVFYARVELCALDITTQRIRRVSSVGVDDNITIEPSNLEITFSNFDTLDLSLKEQVKVKATNIDMSHHTNNIEYIRFIMNTYSVKELENKPIKEMEIIFAGQSFENDILSILKSSNLDKDRIEIQKDNKQIIKCEIVF